MTDLTGNIFIDGPAGRLEALLKEGGSTEATGPPRSRVAIVCHPHPLFGGTMHNKVVYRIAKAFLKADFAVLRFNFRGVGRSEGEHNEGIGEQDDLRAAMRLMEERYPDAGIWLAGFSFGAAVMLRTGCQEERIRALIAAGTPISKYSFSDVPACDKPKLFVHGSLDQYGRVDELTRFFESLKEPKELRVIEGADHFFEGRLEELYQSVYRFIA
jgi:alpha/beta superfamily hydrolase